jgi:hypothetical protein
MGNKFVHSVGRMQSIWLLKQVVYKLTALLRGVNIWTKTQNQCNREGLCFCCCFCFQSSVIAWASRRQLYLHRAWNYENMGLLWRFQEFKGLFVKYLPYITAWQHWRKQIANSVLKAAVWWLKWLMVWRSDADTSETFGFVRERCHSGWILCRELWRHVIFWVPSDVLGQCVSTFLKPRPGKFIF